MVTMLVGGGGRRPSQDVREIKITGIVEKVERGRRSSRGLWCQRREDGGSKADPWRKKNTNYRHSEKNRARP